MKLSKMAITKNKIMHEDNTFAQDILLKTGQLYQYCSGIYGYDNVLYRVMTNVKAVIEKHLNNADCVEVSLPVLQPEDIWIASGRLDKYVEEDVIFRTNSGTQNFCLAPTAEEAIVDFLKNRLTTYKSLPVTFYQIGTKFRNEIRTKGYLIRGKAFEMMDAYSFGRNTDDLTQEYENIRNAYFNIFDELGLETMPVGADNGGMGGKKSEEFMLITNLGEDTIYVDRQAKKAFNSELLERSDAKEYLSATYGIEDVDSLEKCRSLELGHIFQLGTRYSESMGVGFVDADGQTKPFEMGCYGIGVSRVVAVIYENSELRDDKGDVVGYSLPYNIAPYKAHIVYGNNETKIEQATQLYGELMNNGIECLIDDRQDIMFGARIKDANFLGAPYLIVFGNKSEGGMCEIENTKTREKTFIAINEVVDFFKNLEK